MLLRDLGVTTFQANKFAKKGIYTAEDLVRYLPKRYFDCSQETDCLPPNEFSSFTIKVTKVTKYNTSKTSLLKVFGSKNKTGEFIIVNFFNQPWMEQRLESLVGKNVYVVGKLTYSEEYKNYSFNGPIIFEQVDDGRKKIIPKYPKIPRISDEYLEETMRKGLNFSGIGEETLPNEIIQRYHLIPTKTMLRFLHQPEDMRQVVSGQQRLIFDDLLFFATKTEIDRRETSVGSPFQIKSKRVMKKLLQSLPYELTSDQMEAINQCLAIAASGRRINALVQGDVGCGKTIVAVVMMALFADSGYQSVLMAPTQVLARQHYEDVGKLLEPLGIPVDYMDSSLKAKEKKRLLGKIKDGTSKIIIGTQSLISQQVEFKKLAIAVTDEEHRFGVLQRQALVEKASAGVHSITMSATPIPRSLATVIYGDMVELLTIKTMPKGRKPVLTGISTDRRKIYQFIIQNGKKGFQTYVVCPMIEENERLEGVKSVDEVYTEYLQALSPFGIKIGRLTGRDSREKVSETLEAFRRNEIQVLVATSVVEVGVNVPTARLIVITNAERFGLASLHQLRGRVGRSDIQSYCVLESDMPTEESRGRLEAMVHTTNGFDIAKADLSIRGAGDFLGTRQSGENKYLSLILAYPDIYEQTKEAAKELIDSGASCPFLDLIREGKENNEA